MTGQQIWHKFRHPVPQIHRWVIVSDCKERVWALCKSRIPLKPKSAMIRTSVLMKTARYPMQFPLRKLSHAWKRTRKSGFYAPCFTLGPIQMEDIMSFFYPTFKNYHAVKLYQMYMELPAMPSADIEFIYQRLLLSHESEIPHCNIMDLLSRPPKNLLNIVCNEIFQEKAAKQYDNPSSLGFKIDVQS